MRKLRNLLALIAALPSAIAPVLVHAHLSLGAQPGYAEICTERGLARAPAGDGSQPDGRLAAAFAHCAVCVSAGGDQAPAGGASGATLLDFGTSPIIFRADRGASADPVRAPRPRGPPPQHGRPR